MVLRRRFLQLLLQTSTIYLHPVTYKLRYFLLANAMFAATKTEVIQNLGNLRFVGN